MVSYLERKIGERFLLIMYFDRFMSRETLRKFYDAKILEFLIQAEELLSYSYPHSKKSKEVFPLSFSSLELDGHFSGAEC